MTARLGSSTGPLIDQHDVALLDLDGVVYVGPHAVPGAEQALGRAREAGMRLAFVTNNAARPPQVVADHLTELGIAARSAEIVTSAQAAARYLADRLPGGARVLVVGTTGLTEALRERGLVPVETADGPVDAVTQGYSPDLSWRQLAEGAVAINRGVPWVATNVDPTVPSPRGPLPGNGSLVAALRLATRQEPTVTGKPDPTMHREMMLRSGAQRPIAVGDRLDTDIEGANAVGCPSLLVLTGVTTVADLLAAPPGLRPTYVAADLAGLLVAHEAPNETASAVRAGRWIARDHGDVIVLDRHDGDPGAQGDGGAPAPSGEPAAATPTTDAPAPAGQLDDDALDAVRALCTASWVRVDSAPADGADAHDAGQLTDRSRQPTRLRSASASAREMLGRLGLADG